MDNSRRQSVQLMKKGLGEAYHFIEDERVTNIEINGRNGEVHTDGTEGRQFHNIILSKELRRQFLDAAANYGGTEIDNNEKPNLAMALPKELGNCRLEGAIFPITKGPSITLRKPSTKIFPITDYASQEQIDIIRKAIKDRNNILIAGSTDSGKTSLLKSILQLYKDICPNERMVTIEDTEELVPVLKNTKALFTAGDIKDPEGRPLNMKFLLKKSLRENPDRIVLGEVRDDAALTVLGAWDTGHDGGICTFHAGSAQGGFYRFIGGQMAGLDPDKTDDMRFASRAIDLVIYLNKNHKGERRIEEISRISFSEKENTVVFDTTNYK